MTDARFLQIHWLASYPGTLLNRDDAGLAKRLPFGGATRARVSSQSLKRHWRFAGADSLERARSNRWALQNLELPMSVRTKRAVEDRIIPRAQELRPNAPDDVTEAVTNTLLRRVYGDKAEDPKKRQALYLGEPEIEFLAGFAAKALAAPNTEIATELLEGKFVVERQIMPDARRSCPASDDMVEAVTNTLLKQLYRTVDPNKRKPIYCGEPEIAILTELATEALGKTQANEAIKFLQDNIKNRLPDQNENLKTLLKNGAGLGAALFGRMVTSDPAANTDAAIHVAHAMTVHAMERDLDFMTVVDDLKSREEGDDAGAAGVFDMELTSGLYYGYVVVDIGLLADNMAGDREVAARVVEHLVHLIAEVSPGAKKGSTAPYAWAEWMLVEAGGRQPRTLANAFRDPVDLRSNCLLGTTVERLDAHLSALDAAYGAGELRRQMATDPEAGLDKMERIPLDALAAWAAGVVRTGEAA